MVYAIGGVQASNSFYVFIGFNICYFTEAPPCKLFIDYEFQVFRP